MNKILYAATSVGWFCLSSVYAFSGEKVNGSSGGSIHPNGIVKIIRISSSVSGRGKAPLVGLGLLYLGKGKTATSVRNAAPAAVIVKPSAINSEFKLGEVYVYPNPAKGGQVPTFHIEAGIADSVKIRVYTVSGELAHNYTIVGAPSTINDGHGLEYAYEYAWRGRIPSGVYYYAIEAQKAGKKSRKNGKFAILR